MPNVKCNLCSKEFYVKPSHLRYGFGKYCSRTCQFEAQRKGKFINCYICSKKSWKAPRQIKHSKSGKFFCSKSCQTIWRNSMVFVGKNHPNWKGGEFTYKYKLRKSGVEKICTMCKSKDERTLAVHHIDRNRKNNELENLIWLCHNCHFLVHHYKQEMDKLMVALV